MAELTRANEELAGRDQRARAYAEFVRELKTLDVKALAAGGMQSLVRLAGAQVGVVYLLDDADRLVPVHASSADGKAVDHRLFAADGLPRAVLERREPLTLRGAALAEPAPALDLAVGRATLRWVLRYPIALGDEERRPRSFWAACASPRPTWRTTSATRRASSRWPSTTRGRTIACARRAWPSPSKASAWENYVPTR